MAKEQDKPNGDTTLRKIESMKELNLKTMKAMHIRENLESIYKEGRRDGFEMMLKIIGLGTFEDRANDKGSKDDKEALAWDSIMGKE